MTTGIIDKLNAHVGKTPDQIVAQLSTLGWTKGADMPRDQWREWQRADTRLAICSHNGAGDWVLNGVHYSPNNWNLDGVHHSLADYWFMPAENVVNGAFPDG